MYLLYAYINIYFMWWKCLITPIRGGVEVRRDAKERRGSVVRGEVADLLVRFPYNCPDFDLRYFNIRPPNLSRMLFLRRSYGEWLHGL